MNMRSIHLLRGKNTLATKIGFYREQIAGNSLQAKIRFAMKLISSIFFNEVDELL